MHSTSSPDPDTATKWLIMIVSADALTGIFLYGLGGKDESSSTHQSPRSHWLRIITMTSLDYSRRTL
jgi:hypothetical protein